MWEKVFLRQTGNSTGKIPLGLLFDPVLTVLIMKIWIHTWNKKHLEFRIRCKYKQERGTSAERINISSSWKKKKSFMTFSSGSGCTISDFRDYLSFWWPQDVDREEDRCIERSKLEKNAFTLQRSFRTTLFVEKKNNPESWAGCPSFERVRNKYL